MENAIAVRPMIYKEARECVDKINASMTNIRSLVLELYEREGWSALGYQNWRDCVTKEFEIGQSHIYRLLDAAKIEHNISPIGEKEIPEGQLRPLSKLEPDQQRIAWQKAVATVPDGKVTAAHVYKIVRGMTEPEPKPIRLIQKPIIPQEPVSEEFQRAFDQMVIEIKNARAMKWKTTSHKAAIELMQTLLNITEN